MVTVGIEDADYEVTVVGESQECDPVVINPGDTVCVVVSG